MANESVHMSPHVSAAKTHDVMCCSPVLQHRSTCKQKRPPATAAGQNRHEIMSDQLCDCGFGSCVLLVNTTTLS